jgi:hypothetical protein
LQRLRQAGRDGDRGVLAVHRADGEERRGEREDGEFGFASICSLLSSLSSPASGIIRAAEAAAAQMKAEVVRRCVKCREWFATADQEMMLCRYCQESAHLRYRAETERLTRRWRMQVAALVGATALVVLLIWLLK